MQYGTVQSIENINYMKKVSLKYIQSKLLTMKYKIHKVQVKYKICIVENTKSIKYNIT